MRNVTWQFALGSTYDHLILPGGVRDPDFGTNNICWIATGRICRISVDQDTAQDLQIRVYDLMDANGKPLALAATPFHRHAILGPSAATLQGGSGGGPWSEGTAFHEVRIPSIPAVVHANGLRWQQKVEARAANVQPEQDWDVDQVCGHGMGVRITTAGNTTQAVNVSIDYVPDVNGAQRYYNAVRQAGPLHS